MKLFRHYKNKPYKFVGIAKHSESLTDLVVYECRYPNSLAKLWVRPKEIFFENIVVDGQTVPRFLEIPLNVETFEKVNADQISILADLIEKCFGEWDSKWFHSKFDLHSEFYLQIAYVDQRQPVAFKLGFPLDENCFYSWLGGVIPEYRGIGIAKDLMEQQHHWCFERGYEKIQTKSQNRYKDMLLLNLRSGFEIVSTHESSSGGLKIVLEKKLA